MSRNTILTSLLVLGTILCGTASGQEHSGEYPPAGSARETAAATPFSDTAKLRLSDSLAADRLNRHKTILAAWAGVNILQGAFLLVFDLVQYGNHRRNGKILEQQMGNLQFGPTAMGLAWPVTLNKPTPNWNLCTFLLLLHPKTLLQYGRSIKRG